jgi:hypothetical protein
LIFFGTILFRRSSTGLSLSKSGRFRGFDRAITAYSSGAIVFIKHFFSMKQLACAGLNACYRPAAWRLLHADWFQRAHL